ncbi:tetratricopeptide repeat protein [Leptospira borgpetersenii]|uniref:tetratricopeptide repeat protein n=1 Tax=Leptospira borgpetersenii TaxID=174 RepID=UPI0007748B40|nr:tetratricopeptide repeat protein [Leptospira borgpetersenii]
MNKRILSTLVFFVIIGCSGKKLICGNNGQFPEPNLIETSNEFLSYKNRGLLDSRAEKSIIAKIRNLNQNGKYEDSIQSIEEILRDHESQELYFEYGIALMKMGRFEEAIVSFHKCAISLFNTTSAAESLFYMSECYSKLGDQNRSLQFLQHVIDRGFDDKDRIMKSKGLEKLYANVIWKENEKKIVASIINLSEENLIGIVVDAGPSSITLHYLCPKNKLVLYKEPNAYYTEREIFYGNWKIEKDRVALNINEKCFASGSGKESETVEGAKEYEKYEFSGCVSESTGKSKLNFDKMEIASFIRPYYGQQENEATGVGLEFRKFTEIPKQCELDFKPTSIEEIRLETK